MGIRESIIDFAADNGVEYIGFCGTNFDDDFIKRLINRKEMNCQSDFEETDVEKRTKMELLLKKASTLISIALPYKSVENLKSSPYFSKASFGSDYHKVVMQKLDLISEYITDNYGASCICFCDTGPLHDREIAKKCGIGFYGKNSSIINPQYGSYIFLGEILTDIYIDRDNEIDMNCGECDLCIKACPAKAIEEPYNVNYSKCLSYLTQKKGILEDEQIENMGLRLYGCDTCQDVCPFNKKAFQTNIEDFKPEIWNLYPDPVKILNLSNAEFINTYKKTSSGWRGKKMLQRNMIIALGNSGEKNFIPYLKRDFNDKILNEYAKKAIRKLEG